MEEVLYVIKLIRILKWHYKLMICLNKSGILLILNYININ